jgi:hypothetical protein
MKHNKKDMMKQVQTANQELNEMIEEMRNIIKKENII